VVSALITVKPGLSLESKITIHFEEVSRKKTKLSLLITAFLLLITIMRSGWNQSLDKLAAQLPILISLKFNKFRILYAVITSKTESESSLSFLLYQLYS